MTAFLNLKRSIRLSRHFEKSGPAHTSGQPALVAKFNQRLDVKLLIRLAMHTAYPFHCTNRMRRLRTDHRVRRRAQSMTASTASSLALIIHECSPTALRDKPTCPVH